MTKLKILFTVLIALLFFSCDIKTSEQSLPESVGKYGNVLIVIDTSYENTSTGGLLDSILTQPIYGLPQAEPMFSVNTVPHSGFEDILKRASNIIFINVSEGKAPDLKLRKDVWAEGQVVVDIIGKNQSTVDEILSKNSKYLIKIFNDREIERWDLQLKKFLNESLSQEIKDSHNISLMVPKGYYMMKSRDNDFWIKKEKSIGEHQVIQALMVYYNPYTSSSSFDKEEMVSKRDSFTYRYIKGMTDSSYMKVYQEYPVSADTLTVNGMYAVEYRGLWNMENDFMGGPFLHYTILDEKNNRIINLDGFVYAPKFNKREYVRELEAIMKSIDIPS